MTTIPLRSKCPLFFGGEPARQLPWRLLAISSAVARTRPHRGKHLAVALTGHGHERKDQTSRQPRRTGFAPGRRGADPAKLKIRTAIGNRMFTAEFLSDDLEEIESDPQVEDVSLAEPIPLQKMP